MNAPTGYLPSANWNVFSTSSTVGSAVGPLAFSPLAFTLPTFDNNGNSFSAQLAQSWEFKNNYQEFDVHLRKGLKWSDGSPLTSKDVVTSWDLYGVNGVWAGLQLTNVQAVGPTTIKFTRTLAPGQPAYNVGFESALLGQIIAPAKQYQQFVPPASTLTDFETKLWNPRTVVSPDSAEGKKLSTELAGYQKKLVAFNINSHDVLASGPFKLNNFTPSTVLLDKNPDNWAASKNKIDHVKLYNNTDTTAVNNLIVTGTVDAIGYQPNTPLYNSIMGRNRGTMHYVKPPDYLTTLGIIFNQKVYPFNMLPVRQAFMYVVDRTKAKEASDPIAGEVPTAPAGLPGSALSYYLTQNQINSLNPYKFDPSKATSLLQSAGFTKRGDTWYTPKSQKFSVTVYSATTLQSWDLLASNVASQLSDFGIPTKVQLTPVNTYGAQQQMGRFPVFVGYPDGNAYPPYASFTNIAQGLGGWTFSASGQESVNSAGPAYSFQPLNVPGVGMVDPAKLSYQMSSSASQADFKADALKEVQWMNYNANPGVFVYQYQSYFYNTKRFTDWPTKEDSVMRLIGYGSADYFVTVCAEQGYLSPK